jgi:hypothetical protein
MANLQVVLRSHLNMVLSHVNFNFPDRRFPDHSFNPGSNIKLSNFHVMYKLMLSDFIFLLLSLVVNHTPKAGMISQ